MKQYPHIIKLTTVSGNSVQDELGNWIPGTSRTVEVECRAEPNTNVRFAFLQGPDGTRIDYGWIVFMKNPVDDIKAGTTVEVVDKETLGVVCTDKVIQFSRGQLNSRIWL